MTLAYERRLAGDAALLIHRIESVALRDNPLGDPCERHCPLLLPPGDRRGLPLVVVLVGFTGSGPRVLNVTLWEENLPERIARLTAEGAIPPAVYLWPSCETSLGGSQYRNSSATGRYEDFLRDELVPDVEARYDCGGAGRRVVVGKSSGGYGALTLAMRNPGLFAAAGSHAGDMGFEFGYRRDFPDALTAWRKHGGPAAFLAALRGGQLKLGRAEHAAVDTIAMAACYSPNPRAELGCDLPVDPETGEPRDEVFARWLEKDPLRKVEKPEFAAGLASLQALYLDAGESDEFALQWGLRRFLPCLGAHGIAHRSEFFEGGHFGIDHRYEVSLPYLLAAVY